MTAVYLQILIHAMNNSLLPNVDPGSIAWTGPPPEIVTVQSLLYASLATSLFAAFLAMLGKQWVNRYLRNHGGSAAEKSRDRQLKLDGFEKWYFYLAIESLPVMLQLALLLLGCALALYLWTISRAVAWVILAFTLFGVTSYTFLTLAAIPYYHCPYQTPPSIVARTVLGYLAHSDTAFAGSLRSLIALLPSVKNLGPLLIALRSGTRNALKSLGCIPAVEAEHIPLAVVMASPTPIFEDLSINLDICEADARCISWVLSSNTDPDVIFSTVRFAADMIWYPKIAGVVSPHILANLFFDCFLDGQVIPSKLEHATSIGMALASVLSVQLSMEPGSESLKELCKQIISDIRKDSTSPSTFQLILGVLRFVAKPFTRNEPLIFWEHSESVPDRLSPMHELWLSRVILQTVWRWRHVKGPAGVLVRTIAYRKRVPVEESITGWDSFCPPFTADENQIPVILRTNHFLIMAISLGLQVDIRDLYPPNDK
jgi:hypothetical protein